MLDFLKKLQINIERNMENKDFAVFILSYGRASKVHTIKTLKKGNYSGKTYVVCSDDDSQLDQYKEKFKNIIHVFKKSDYVCRFDIADNFNDDRVVVYARNAVFDIARKLGIKYFLVLDDDYISFRYTQDGNGNYLTKVKNIKDLNFAFDSMLNYFKKTNAKTLCMAQGGDFIGGDNSSVFKKKLSRKAMNLFVCSTERPFNFIGRINEDVCTYVNYGAIGDLFLTICDYRLEQLETQSNSGGLTEFYLNEGTYVKSFYTLLFRPSCTKISLMGDKNKRLHHKVDWKYAVPCIIREELKKKI